MYTGNVTNIFVNGLTWVITRKHTSMAYHKTTLTKCHQANMKPLVFHFASKLLLLSPLYAGAAG